MSHACHSRVFSSVTRLLALLESTAEAPHQQVTKQVNRPFLIMVSSFRWPTTILTVAITMTCRRRSGICIQALHSYQSAFKEVKIFSSDLLALSSEHLPFHTIFIHNMAKDVWTVIRKRIVVSFLHVPCLVAFLGFHPCMLLHLLEMLCFFCNLYHCNQSSIGNLRRNISKELFFSLTAVSVPSWPMATSMPIALLWV